ncbi:hypothetical protein [Mycolicibacterium brisbanense]|uniref:DUF3291 domain-containing protein n=1 Tax=Mycolicibacterium brisbanense TaxID=146020 RepID=A0A100W164_9MYCO|nr:hypothetical protein [Mycolicibacterium brisbanense]MCV7160110.1 hypothetical protein [Mycolicibacterium brisbanense]GAS89708.1 uncharacterized protein RMCB_3804 [Mycolicibacterium brisbanense]
MTVITDISGALAQPLVTSWMPGPVDPADNPVVVSVTEYTAQRRRDVPGIAVHGMRMREGWYAMPGAVGLWLWSMPTPGRTGSISVWTDEEALQRFITLPHHVRIMQSYGPRGEVRSTTWHAESFDPAATVARARGWILDR